MTNTTELIAQLAHDSKSVQPLRTPRFYAYGVMSVCILYLLGAQWFLGIRPDIFVQLTRPLFVLEISALLTLFFLSIFAAIILMRPDNDAHRGVLQLPFLALVLLFFSIALQWMLPVDSKMVMPAFSVQGRECALCIAVLSLVPSAMLFSLLRKGANTMPARAGIYSVLAASAIGCITQRIAEMNDSLMHLVVWHYLPTLLFAALGAWLGKRLLRW